MAERNFQSWHPVLGVRSMEQAIDYYVDWLGFQLDGEWKEAPGEPRIAWVSRDGLEIALNEHPGTPSNVWLNIKVADAQALADEWNERRPGAAEVISAAPYEFPVIYLTHLFPRQPHPRPTAAYRGRGGRAPGPDPRDARLRRTASRRKEVGAESQRDRRRRRPVRRHRHRSPERVPRVREAVQAEPSLTSPPSKKPLNSIPVRRRHVGDSQGWSFISEG